MSDKEQMAVVYHAAGMGNFREVVAEQMLLLREVGIADMLTRSKDSVRLTHVGEGLDWILAEAARQDVPMHLVKTSDNVSHCETFAMLEIERLAKEIDTPIMYFHTKGVSHHGGEADIRRNWRHAMQGHTIRPWRRNLETLKTYDAVGMNFWFKGANHFSGTFWVANVAHLRQLPDFATFHGLHKLSRYSCELWIGARSGTRVMSLGCNDLVTWNPGFDWSWLLPAAAPPAVTITWLSASTPKFMGDARNLQRSAELLGAGQRFQLVELPEAGAWKHRMKLDVLLEQLARMTTTHCLWIDADSEFLCPLLTSDLVDLAHPLIAVRHFAYGAPRDHLPRHLVGQLKRNADLYHQSCLFGGERSALIELLRELTAFREEDVAYDEHCLNILWDAAGPDKVLTLPCRYAKPVDFAPFPSYEASYHARAEGPARIIHCNREIRR